jgi:hypothetical protein
MSANMPMTGKVVDAASDTFRMHLELLNPNGALPVGRRCKRKPAPGQLAEASDTLARGACRAAQGELMPLHRSTDPIRPLA